MYAVAVAGSPREQGNTSLVLQKILETLKGKGWKTKFISLAKLKIEPCADCQLCVNDKECPKHDDTKELFEELTQADAIILGSPSYFQDTSAQLKAVMDRTRPLYRKELLRGKVGLAISVEAESGAEPTIASINRFFDLHRIVHLPGAKARGYEERDVLHDLKSLRCAMEAAEELDRLARRLG